MKRALIAGLLLASLAAPATNAQAGFWTDVLKNSARETVRKTKKVTKDAADFTKMVGSCALKRARGQPC